MHKGWGGRWAVLWLVVWGSTGCLRLLTPDNRPADGGAAQDAAVTPVVVESLAVEFPRADAGPLTVLGYGGDVLRVLARGFDVAVQPRVLLAGLPLVTAPGGLDGGPDDAGSLDPDGGARAVTLRVLLPEQKVMGAVEVVVGERLGRSVQSVSVLGRGHPDQPRMSGTVETQMAIRSAGTTNIPCGPPISADPDGGTEHAHCGALQLDPGRVALAFSFGPTLVFREPTYLAQLNFFGGINRVLALPEEPYRNIAGVQAFTAADDGPGFVTQDVVGLADGTFLPRQVIHPAEGGPQDASVVEPAVPVGLRMGAADFVILKLDHDAGPGFTPTRNGRDFYASAAAPRIPGVPSAVGYVAQGYDPGGDFFGSATVVTASCQPATQPGHVHVDRLLTESGGIYSTRRAIPTTLRRPEQPNTPLFGCDVFLDGGRPECEALARCPDCNTLPSCADDPSCRMELTDMLACAQNATCGSQLRPMALCVATPACRDALVHLLEGDAGNPCTSPACMAALSCLTQPGQNCARGAACLLDPRCVPPPSCAQDGGRCAEKITCALDEACTAQAACESNGNCAEVESCYQHLCQGASQEEGRGSFPRQLVPLIPGVMMVQEQPSPLPFNAAPQPLCGLELFTGTVFPLLPTDILAGAYAAVEDQGDGHTRLLMVPPGGNQLLVYDIQGQSLESSPTRTPYKQLVTDGVYPLVYAVPENGGRVDVLDSQGTFSGSIHALGPALVSFPLPAEDGRMLAFHQDFLLLTDGAGVVQQHLFRAFTPGALEPPTVANGLPAFAWTLRPPVPPEQDVMLERVSLSLDADLGTPSSTFVAPEGLRRANVVAVLNQATGAPRLLLQLVDAPDTPDHPCVGVGGTSVVPYLALMDTAVVPLVVQPIMETCGHRAMAFHPALQQVLMYLEPESGDYGTRRLDLSQATPTVLDPTPLLPALNAVPHPNGSFLGLFVNSVNGAFRLELGQVLGSGADAYRTVAEVDFSDPVMTLSPDGERLYVGRSGSVLEVELSAESTHPERWLNARTLRGIAIDGQADLLQMDSQGTRLLYLDYQHQLTGLVE